MLIIKNNFQLLSHKFQGEAQLLQIKYKNFTHNIKLNLIGKIQLKNVQMAIAAAIKSDIDIKKILRVIPKIKSVEGRFEKIGKIKNQSKVILDYAHTPDALRTCLLNLKEQFPGQKISLVFGCGGNRDQNKRAKMGKIADIFANKIYLTDDNPRTEDPNKIRNDIKKGIKKQTILEFPNRTRAITEAINNLNTGEILLVAGKGHETIQEIGVKKIIFSDKKVILNTIKIKNLSLSNDLKFNILKELSEEKKLSSRITLKKAQINSKEIKKGRLIYCPPYTLISSFSKKFINCQIGVGGQNCHESESYGAYTGHINSRMLKNAGAHFVIIGHSENRTNGENDKLINLKIKNSINSKIKVIFCIGETLSEKRKKKSLKSMDKGGSVIFIKSFSKTK